MSRDLLRSLFAAAVFALAAGACLAADSTGPTYQEKSLLAPDDCPVVAAGAVTETERQNFPDPAPYATFEFAFCA